MYHGASTCVRGYESSNPAIDSECFRRRSAYLCVWCQFRTTRSHRSGEGKRGKHNDQSDIASYGSQCADLYQYGHYGHVLAQELGFFDHRKTGEIVSRLGSDTQLVEKACSQHLTESVNGFLKVLACFGFMFFISWKMTLVILATAVAVLLVCGPFGAFVGVLTRRYQDALGKAANCSTEAIGAMRTVRAFAGEGNEFQRYILRIGDPDLGWWPTNDASTLRVGVTKALAMAAFIPLALFIFLGAMHGILWYGFILCLEGEITIGKLSAFQGYIFNLGFGIAQVAANVVALLSAMGGAARIVQILERHPQLPQKPLTHEMKVDYTDSGVVTAGERATFLGDVHFDQVEFAYPSRLDVKVLNSFTLHVPAQTSAAIVGSSGGGKSSALAVLARFYHPQGGKVLIDGHDVASYGVKFLRQHMTLVQQEPVLFGVTVKENVSYGCSFPVTDAQIIEACRQANAHDFIAGENSAGFPEGYLTLVGERGVRLSGGQKQRIAIARALILQPKILLLDEATSALDTESEQLVQEAIDRVMVGRTVLVVAHRLSTVVDADQIAMCVAGSVLDSGRHAELLERCPEYANLVKRQLGGDRASVARGLDLLVGAPVHMDAVRLGPEEELAAPLAPASLMPS